MITPFATTLAENNFGDTVPNGVAGPMGLFITLLMVVALFLLMRNMNKRLRKLPESFPIRRPSGAEAAEQMAAAPASQPGAQVAVAEPGAQVNLPAPAAGEPETGSEQPAPHS